MSLNASGNRYDSIFVGATLSNLVAANSLLDKGKSVLVLNDEPECDFKSPQFLQTSLTPFIALDRVSQLNDLLSQWGFIDSVFSQPEENNIHLITPKIRFRLSANLEQIKKEYFLELGKEGERRFELFQSYTNEKAADIVWAAEQAYPSKKKKELFSENKRVSYLEDPLLELLPAVVAHYTNMVPLHLSEQLQRGFLSSFIGAKGFLEKKPGAATEFLMKRLVTNGGVIKKTSPVKELVSEGKRIAGVIVASYEGVLWGSDVVLGERHGYLYGTLNSNLIDNKYKYELQMIEPRNFKISFLLELQKGALPQSLSDQAVFVHNSMLPLEEENYIQLRKVPRGFYEQKMGVAESELVLMSLLIPYQNEQKDSSYIQKLAGRCCIELERYFPFFRQSIINVNPEFRTISAEAKKSIPVEFIANRDERMTQDYFRGSKNLQALKGIPISSPHQNLYCSGRVVWPQFGRTGELLTGAALAQILNRQI